MKNVKIEIYSGVGKNSGKPFEAVKLTIGKYSNLLFPTPIEMDYVKKVIHSSLAPATITDDEDPDYLDELEA